MRPDRERLNLFADHSLKKYGGELNPTDKKKKAEYEAELNRLRRFINKKSSVLDISAGFCRVSVQQAKDVGMMTVVEPAILSRKRMPDRKG